MKWSFRNGLNFRAREGDEFTEKKSFKLVQNVTYLISTTN